MKLRLEEYIENDFPLALVPVYNNADFPLHTHDYLELVIVFGGSGTHIAEDRKYPIGTGDVFVIVNNMKHGYINTEGINLVNILFDLSKLNLPVYDLRRLPGFHILFELEPKSRKKHEFKSKLNLGRKDIARVRSIVERMQLELERKNPGYMAISVALLIELIVFISRYSPKTILPERQTISTLGKIISFMEENYVSRISLDTLAKQANMSKRNFLRIFKNITGTSPVNYLLNIRIRKAKDFLLNHKNRPISEIAQIAGFPDSNYFSRQFHNITGISPKKYRKNDTGKPVISFNDYS